MLLRLPSPQAVPRVAHDATPRQPPVPYPVPVAPVQQVLLHIKLLELNQKDLRRFGLDFSQTQLLQGLPGLNGSVETLREEGLVRVLAEPTLVTVMERPARFRSGGEVKLWDIGPDGKPVQRAEHLGTCVDFVPHLIDKRDLRIELRVEVSELDRTKTVFVAGKENPAIRKRVVDTALEVKLGETSALTCSCAHRRRREKLPIFGSELPGLEPGSNLHGLSPHQRMEKHVAHLRRSHRPGAYRHDRPSPLVSSR